MSFIFNFSDPPTSFSIRASASPNSSVVTLLDYGAGNVRSVRNAIHSLGFSIKDVESPQDILNAERLVFPGVGAFAAAMDFINQNGRRMSTYLQKSKKEFGQMVWGFCPYQINWYQNVRLFSYNSLGISNKSFPSIKQSRWGWVWSCPIGAFPELEVGSFQSSWEADSGHGLMVAYHCNRYVSKGIMLQMDEGLEQTLIRSRCRKCRLLYFFPA